MVSTRAVAPSAATLLSACALLAGCGPHKAAMPPQGPPQVGVVTIQPETVTLTTELPGRTTAYIISDVRPQVNGIIKSRPFTEGTDVKAGQLLYQIDPAPYQAAYDQARGTLATAQAVVNTDRLKAERYADLLKDNAVARQDYDDAVATYHQALATVEQDRAAVESARINLGYTRVTAPVSGRIGRSAYTVGALVTASQTNALATIQALDPIYVDVVQSSDDMLRLKRELAHGQISGAGPESARVRVVLSDGTTYPLEGRLRFAEASVDQSTGSVTLRAIIPNPNHILLPGMYVRAQIVEGVQPNGVLAPQPAISRDEKGQPTAFVVDAQNHVQARVLTTSRAIGDKWLVDSGLSAGDRLIVEGTAKVKPGMPVQPVPTGSNPPPGASAGSASPARSTGGAGVSGATGAPSPANPRS